MFLEHPYNRQNRRGWIEVIVGSMFSGKTEELIRRLKRAKIAKQKVEIFKPVVDHRYHESNVVSHDENVVPSTAVQSSSQILLYVNDADVIGIDEAQFFDNQLSDVCNSLANNGVRVIVAGLDMDFQGNPFGPIPALMATAEYVTKVHAVCIECGNLAQHSHRTVDDKSLVVLGEKDIYEPLCRSCFNKKRQK
ncbi:MAG TPA: thymidine kinase [Bacteroidales bacterium]|nr:thymidine kinase [Bacteroidales bacterium]